jgi:hypothetical protein
LAEKVRRAQRAARAGIDPLDPQLRPHLGLGVLTDAAGRARFRFRLIGSSPTEIVGSDSTGKYLDEVYSPAGYEYMIVGRR